MDYQESRAYIKEAEKYGSVLGLQNMRELMARLGNPQNSLKYVHVAGTNGKGSVIAYLYSALSAGGYRIGRYISPAIFSYRERMETAGEPVSREKFAEYVTKTADVIEEMTEEGLPHPTPFEIETAVAFLFFKEENCDLVLLEVGMGGDLDATNIIPSPVLAVIVSVSMDHMSFLGNTLEEIAQKKAGIIKPGCRMVTAVQKPEAETVIRRVCRTCQVEYVQADYRNVTVVEESISGQTFVCDGETYSISLAGVYQQENGVLALKALDLLHKCGFPTTTEQRKLGLSRACWEGRFSVIARDPLFVVDGAHNPAAADMLVSSVQRYFKGKKIYYIMGMFRDKDYVSVIEKTYPYAEKILTIAAPGNPRALPASDLAHAVSQYHSDVQAMDSLSEAVEKAYSLAEAEDVILAFGSLAFIGELEGIVQKREDKKND
ncbi:MAG: folylpolyglutamate synthase/dihydrofolate synthase family protein [Eubacteriales bacterium]|nr:folylpolyglutamate synthase/dihydrofolate synthase family protein [Eubacteriales bacterium]